MRLSSASVMLVMLCLLCGSVHALMIYQNESQLIRTSDQIVYGTIIDVQSGWNAQKTHIETTALIRVNEAFVADSGRGMVPGTTVPVTIQGGRAGDLAEWAEDMPIFELGSEAFVYLEKTRAGTYTVHGLRDGIHTVPKDGSPGITSSAEVARFRDAINQTLKGLSVELRPPASVTHSLPAPAASSGPAITSVTPSSASAGTESMIKITGSGFGNTHLSNGNVFFFAQAVSYSGGVLNWISVSNSTNILSWTDTEINVKVPFLASSGFIVVRTDDSAVSNYFPFAVTFGYGGTKWSGSPTYYINPGSVNGAGTAIQNAAATWNNAGSSFRLNYGGTTSIAAVAGDLKNVIFFGPPSDFPDNQVATTWYRTYIASGNLADIDTEFNTYYAWTTGTGSGTTLNIETVMAHEFGHWLLLNDLYGDLPQLGVPGGYPSDITPEMKMMFYTMGDSLGNMNQKTLAPSDIAGICWIYSGCGEPSQGLTVTAISPASGPNTGSVSITNLAGSGFANGASVILVRGGYDNISATAVTVVSTTKITCTLPLSGAAVGQYSVVVKNTNGNEAVLTDGFTVYAPVTLMKQIGVFRPSLHNFYLQKDSASWIGINWGTTTDTPLTGDWNGDLKTEVGVFRPSTHMFYLKNGTGTWSTTAINWGTYTDRPVTGDWNGDLKTEVGVFRPSTHTFYLRSADYPATPASVINWGSASDTPITGDWNGDHVTEVGVFRPSTHTFYLRGANYPSTPATLINWGAGSDIPVTEDWDGNGITEVGVFRPSLHTFYLRPADYPASQIVPINWGVSTDIPVAGAWA